MDAPAPVSQSWLSAGLWARANRELLAKALTEFMYEEIITPDIADDGWFSIDLRGGTPADGTPGSARADGTPGSPLPGRMLSARARRRALGWWRVDPNSLGRNGGDPPEAATVLALLAAQLGVAPATVANLVSELSSTVLADAWQLSRSRPSTELLDREPVVVESELRGHPWIVANKGRVGFSADDTMAYTPEAGQHVRVVWLAASPAIADSQAAPGLDHHRVVREQVGDAEFASLRAQAQLGGLDPDTCAYIPVHPWQWAHRISTLHAGELATGSLVHLGEGSARYRPQLAIRTLTDIDHPERRYLKLPVSVLNTSVYRGLPRERTIAAPALTAWLCGLAAGDPYLRETGVILLGEVASVSVAHPTFDAITGVPYQHTEMLGAIWRESVQPRLAPGERAVSLAALLHVDADGVPFAGVLLKQSGLAADEWVRRLHAAILPPLLHVLYKYGAMFSPHGQNCMIVHRDGMPTRLVIKDFVDDVAICSEALPEHEGLDPVARAALADVSLDATSLLKYLQNGLLICVYRYLAEIAEDQLGLPETSFWALVREELGRYQRRFRGELGDRFAMFDLETPTFPKLCLNRLRLFERGYDDDADRPVISAVGTVRNPLAGPPASA